jgi:hypothetical protein
VPGELERQVRCETLPARCENHLSNRVA